MNERQFIEDKIKIYFEIEEHNCAVCVIKVLSERFDFPIEQQTLDACLAQNGLGQYGAQCGLITGATMFLGIVAAQNNWEKEKLYLHTRELTALFEKKFKSLLCSAIRPEGFHEDNPPYICQPRTVDALEIFIDYLKIHLD
ncbi:MAG: C_GCAxxG_C_C family protein [candidate division Zixibacteria bacterium]|nr:C_GCAxxG_C_C family protein [candidate division Zixibacteria bacterium]